MTYKDISDKCYFKELAEDKAIKEQTLTERDEQCLRCKPEHYETCFEYIPLGITRFIHSSQKNSQNITDGLKPIRERITANTKYEGRFKCSK